MAVTAEAAACRKTSRTWGSLSAPERMLSGHDRQIERPDAESFDSFVSDHSPAGPPRESQQV
jgi:hypothetical protein